MFSKSAEYQRILALIPGTDPDMLDRFLGGQQISPTTARIWAEQGVLSVFSGELRKMPPPDDDFFACPSCLGSALKFAENSVVYCLDPDCWWEGDTSYLITPDDAFIGPLTLEETYG